MSGLMSIEDAFLIYKWYTDVGTAFILLKDGTVLYNTLCTSQIRTLKWVFTHRKQLTIQTHGLPKNNA